MNKSLGKPILEALNKFEASKVSSTKDGHYCLDMPQFVAEVFISDEGYHLFELTLKETTNKRGRKLCYHIDNDGGHDPDRSIAKSIEKDIVATLDSLRNGKILIGTRKGRSALAVPDNGGYVLTALGKVFDYEARYDSFQHLHEKGKFKLKNLTASLL